VLHGNYLLKIGNVAALHSAYEGRRIAANIASVTKVTARLAVAMLCASEAFAMPYCTGGTFKDGHFVCTSLDDNQ